MKPQKFTPSHRRILIVDDNPAIHDDFRKILAAPQINDDLKSLEAAMFGQPKVSEPDRYELESAYQGQEALQAIEKALEIHQPFSLAFVDMRMPPGWDGLETIQRLWQADPELQVVICSAYSDQTREQILERTGRSHRLVILKKPFDNAEIAQLACAMTEKWRASRLASMQMQDLEQEVARRTADIDAANGQLSERLQQVERIQKELLISQERFALAARGSNDGLWDWDLGRQSVFYSARWRTIAGLPDFAGDDTPEFWLSRVHPNDSPSVKAAIEHHLNGRNEHLECEHRLRRPDGKYVWVLCRGATVRDASGTPCRLAGSLTDISRRKEIEDQLRHGAYYDRLTGLPNRALLKECLERSLQRVRENPASSFALLFIGFDRFKMVNDSLGHMAGDQLLMKIATRLTSLVSVRQGHTLARLGGDEFVLMVETVEDERDAAALAQSIHDVLEAPFEIQGQVMHTTASIGIAVGNESYVSADEVLRDADTAMYHAKSGGRARHVHFTRSMRDDAVSRLQLENDLRGAVQRGEIGLAYQPIVCLRTNRIVALEALARWEHPDLGFITPDRFIAIAEETGLIIGLGELVLRKALGDLHRLQHTFGHSDLCVNVNLSSRQFSHASLVADIQAMIQDSGVNASTLCIELTETAVMDSLETATATIRRFRDLGVNIALDDFGTGYSSLSSLRCLPLTSLKLDRSFVAQLSSGYTVPAIIHAIVTLANHLRLKVVAEGIETYEQMAGIIALECDFAQGYLIGKPMPSDRIATWLATAAGRAIAA